MDMYNTYKLNSIVLENPHEQQFDNSARFKPYGIVRSLFFLA